MAQRGYGLRPHLNTSADENVSTIKSDEGHLLALEVSHLNATTDLWLQLFDESGSITVGTTTPKLSIQLPAGDGTVYGNKVLSLPAPGLLFQNSIKYAVTTGPATSGAPSSAAIVNAIYS